jgi:tetratricopeptide (TPR) repeat protein
VPDSGRDAQQIEALARRYPDAKARKIAELYHEGQLDKALKRLGKLIKRTQSAEARVSLERMRQQMLVVGGTYQEGFAAYRARRVARSEQAWGTLLAADGKLMPANMDSFYRREVTRALGRLYYDLGNEEFGLGRYPTAFGHWRRGKQVDPSNAEILNGLLQLEKVAERLIRQADRLVAEGLRAEAIKKLSLARGITEKGRQIHDAAQAQLMGLRSSR